MEEVERKGERNEEVENEDKKRLFDNCSFN